MVFWGRALSSPLYLIISTACSITTNRCHHLISFGTSTFITHKIRLKFKDAVLNSKEEAVDPVFDESFRFALLNSVQSFLKLGFKEKFEVL